MSDEELTREGKAGRHMCSPMANFDKPPGRVFVVQLEEVKAEWKRRHPKSEDLGKLDRDQFAFSCIDSILAKSPRFALMAPAGLSDWAQTGNEFSGFSTVYQELT